MDTKDIVTICIATYGALLSTFVFISQQLDKRTRIRVSANPGFQVGAYGASQDMYIFVETANVGQVDVTLSSFAFRLPNKQMVTFPFLSQSVQFPYELPPGKSCSLRFPVVELCRGLSESGYQGVVPLVPQIRDQIGKSHRGGKFKFDIAAWSK